MKRAIVEIIYTVIVEYDKQTALDDFCSEGHPFGGVSCGKHGNWDAEPTGKPEINVRTKGLPVKKGGT